MSGEVWTGPVRPELAARIEEYWQSSEYESTHRRHLAELCARYTGPADSVLELGCGTGLVFEQLSARHLGNRYVGADLATSMLSLARAKFPETRFLCADGYRLPFRGQAFDVVICFEVLGHVLDSGGLLAELIRLAKKRLIFTIWPAADGVIEEQQEIDGLRFPYRYYSHGYVMGQLGTAGGGSVRDVDLATMGGDCWGYVAECDAGPPPARPRLRSVIPIPANPVPGPFRGT